MTSSGGGPCQTHQGSAKKSPGSGELDRGRKAGRATGGDREESCSVRSMSIASGSALQAGQVEE